MRTTVCDSLCWAGLTSKIQPRSFPEAGARDATLNPPKSPDTASEAKRRRRAEGTDGDASALQRGRTPAHRLLLQVVAAPRDVATGAVRRGSAGQARQNPFRGWRPADGAAVRGPAAAPGQGGLPRPRRLPLVAVPHLRPDLHRRPRRPGPLLAVLSRWRGDACVDLVDLSGDVVKRIRTTTTTGGYEHRGRVLCTHFNYVIFSGDHHRVSILEPISGSIFAIPQGVGEDVARANGTCHPAWFAMGQVPSSGCYKLLRIVEDINTRDLACELFTFGDGIGQWKKVRSPRANLYPSCTNGVVVNGFTYFFYDHWEIEEPYINADNMGTCFIPSFNLETESWGKTLQGPFSLIMEDGLLSYIDPTDPLNLGEIEGCLVTIHCNDQISTINMWFLIDLENQLWSKKIVIQNEVVARDVIQGMQDLWMLEEGKMILLVRTMSRDILRIYDPTTNTARNVCRTSCLCYAGVGIYTKSLLSNC